MKKRRLDHSEPRGIEENSVHFKTGGITINGIVSCDIKRPLTVSSVGKHIVNNLKEKALGKFTTLKSINGVGQLCKYDNIGTESVSTETTTGPRDEIDGDMLDLNLNNISGCIRNENLQQLYEKKLLSSDINSSPFKGKMSAFEISLLKGKQNLERRKSLESAALRSSPRTNRLEYKRPNYSDTKRVKPRQLLDEVAEERSDEHVKDKKHEEHGAVRPKKRKRTVSNNNKSVAEDVEVDSPYSSRNKLRISDPSKRFTYRINGSNRRNSLPTRLSLSSLSSYSSGKQNKQQGQSSRSSSSSTAAASLERKTSHRQRFQVDGISGRDF